VAYALLAVAGGRLVDRSSRQERGASATALGVNLALNAGWTWIFFRARRPGWATVEAGALDASTIDLVRRAWRVDRTAALLLVPYAVWTGFATALSASVEHRNDAG
jgi:benzodiazapine receptor